MAGVDWFDRYLAEPKPTPTPAPTGDWFDRYLAQAESEIEPAPEPEPEPVVAPIVATPPVPVARSPIPGAVPDTSVSTTLTPFERLATGVSDLGSTGAKVLSGLGSSTVNQLAQAASAASGKDVGEALATSRAPAEAAEIIEDTLKGTGQDVGTAMVGALTAPVEAGSRTIGGLAGVGQAVGELAAQRAQTLGKPTSSALAQKFADIMGRQGDIQQEFREVLRPPGSDRNLVIAFLRDVEENIPQLGLVAALGPTAAISTLGAQSGGEEYRQARKSGASVGQAATSGAVSGAAEGVFERYLGDVKLVKAMMAKGGMGAKTAGDVVGQMFKYGNLNGLEEIATSIAQRAGQEITYTNEYPDDWKSALQQDLQTAARSYLLGFAVGGPVAGGAAAVRMETSEGPAVEPTPKVEPESATPPEPVPAPTTPEPIPVVTPSVTLTPAQQDWVNQGGTVLQTPPDTSKGFTGRVPKGETPPAAPVETEPVTRPTAPPPVERRTDLDLRGQVDDILPKVRLWSDADMAQAMDQIREKGEDAGPLARAIERVAYERSGHEEKRVRRVELEEPKTIAEPPATEPTPVATPTITPTVSPTEVSDAQAQAEASPETKAEPETVLAPPVEPAPAEPAGLAEPAEPATPLTIGEGEPLPSGWRHIPSTTKGIGDKYRRAGGAVSQEGSHWTAWLGAERKETPVEGKNGKRRRFTSAKAAMEYVDGQVAEPTPASVAPPTLTSEPTTEPKSTTKRAKPRVKRSVPSEALGISPTVSSTLTNPLPIVRKLIRNWFTARGPLSPDAFKATERKTAAVTGQRVLNLDMANALRVAAARHVKRSGTDADAVYDAINDRLDGLEPTTPLPAHLDQLARAARREIDRLSQQAIDEPGLISDSLKETFGENLGQYITRTYEVFENPDHLKKLRDSGRWESLKSELRELDEYADLGDEEIEGEMAHLATRSDPFFGIKGQGVGTQDVGIYKQRKQIPRVIREIMGEHADPSVRFFKSAERLARNIHTFRMYKELEEIGTREGWLHERPIGEFFTEIKGEKTRTPAAGKFTTADLARELSGADQRARFRILSMLTGIVKFNLTVGSIQGQARNLESNFLLLAGGGNLGAKWMPWGRASRGQKYGVMSGARDFSVQSGKRLANMSEELDLDKLTDDELAGEYARAAKLGVVGTNVDLNDIRHFMSGADRLVGEGLPKHTNIAARAIRGAKHLYRAGDEVFKLAGWRSETSRQMWMHPQMSRAEAEKVAADIVRDIMPTADRQPRIVKTIRQTPLIGGFISFISEIPRNAYNIGRIAFEEIETGKREGNKRQVQSGVIRLASLGAAITAAELTKLAFEAARDAIGDDDRDKRTGAKLGKLDDEAIHEFLPPWMRNNAALAWRKDADSVIVLDLGFSDPWAQLKKPLYAAIRAGDAGPLERAKDAFKAFFEPYYQEGLVVGPLVDVARNKTERGRDIVPSRAPLPTRLAAYANYLREKWEPGTLRSIERIGKAFAGKPGAGERTYDPATELLALGGPRLLEINIPKALEFSAYDFLESKRQSGREFRKSEGKVEGSPSSIWADAVATMNRKIDTAKRFGLSDDRIDEILRDSGLSAADVESILGKGDYKSRREMMPRGGELAVNE